MATQQELRPPRATQRELRPPRATQQELCLSLECGHAVSTKRGSAFRLGAEKSVDRRDAWDGER